MSLSPYFTAAGVEIFHGDCRTVLRALPAGSVQMCVTSPPYFNLRDYGTGQWEDGDPTCDHKMPGTNKVFGNPEFNKNRPSREQTQTAGYRETCGKCGARRIDNQIGLEPTPAEYVATMVEVFREVRRVLRDDATVWLNLGDSYASGGRRTRDPGQSKIHPAYEGDSYADGLRPADPPGVKPKDILGIPWSVAFALRDDGWYLRSDIIWHKPNPMPESVTDRPTKAHEYLFLLSKRADYYYDYEAVMEPGADSSVARLSQDIENQVGSTRANGGRKTNGNMKAVAQHKQMAMGRRLESSSLGSNDEPLWRNRRSVWSVTTQPFSGAHFATFPPDLIEPCILAGSKPGDAVLDPFNGSGTTGEVCQKWGRRYVGIELNAAYIDLSAERFRQGVLFGSEVA